MTDGEEEQKITSFNCFLRSPLLSHLYPLQLDEEITDYSRTPMMEGTIEAPVL